MADSEGHAEDKSPVAGGQSGSDDEERASTNTMATGASKAALSQMDGPHARTLNKAADDEEGEESEAKDKDKATAKSGKNTTAKAKAAPKDDKEAKKTTSKEPATAAAPQRTDPP